MIEGSLGKQKTPAKSGIHLLRLALNYSFFTFISRMFGLARDLMIASFLGAGAISDAFFAAFRIPNTFRRMCADGAMSPAFVPVFSSIIDNHPKYAKRFAGEAIIMMTGITSIIVILLEIWAPQALKIIIPGFKQQPQAFQDTVTMLRVNLPFLISASITAIMGSMLNSLNRFSYFAIMPVFLSITMMGFMKFLGKNFAHHGICLSYAVLTVALLQPLIMLFFCHIHDTKPILRIHRMTIAMKNFIRRMIPVIISQSAFQINMFTDVIFASFLTANISYLYYTDRIGQFATTIIGHTLGIVSLPLLSRQIKNKNIEAALLLQKECIKWAIILAIPTTAFLFFFSSEVVSCLYERNHFQAKDTAIVSHMLSCYVVSVLFISMNRIYNACLSALGKSATAMKVSMISIAFNLLVNIALMRYAAYYSVVLATVCSAILESCLTTWVLRKRYQFLQLDKDAAITFIKCVCATVIMIISMCILQRYINSIMHTTYAIIVIAIISAMVYAVCTLALGVVNMKDLYATLRR